MEIKKLFHQHNKTIKENYGKYEKMEKLRLKKKKEKRG